MSQYRYLEIKGTITHPLLEMAAQRIDSHCDDVANNYHHLVKEIPAGLRLGHNLFAIEAIEGQDWCVFHPEPLCDPTTIAQIAIGFRDAPNFKISDEWAYVDGYDRVLTGYAAILPNLFGDMNQLEYAWRDVTKMLFGPPPKVELDADTLARIKAMAGG